MDGNGNTRSGTGTIPLSQKKVWTKIDRPNDLAADMKGNVEFDFMVTLGEMFEKFEEIFTDILKFIGHFWGNT